MNIWKNTFEEFMGPGFSRPSEMMRISEDEATSIIKYLSEIAMQKPTASIGNIHCSNSQIGFNTVLHKDSKIIGFYSGSYLWISPEHRGKGLSSTLIRVAAEHRGGKIMPPNVVSQGYTRISLNAHRKVYATEVINALMDGHDVSEEVLKSANIGMHHPKLLFKSQMNDIELN